MNANKEKWILLLVLTLIWGSSFILIKKSLQYFNPYQVGALRVLIAGLILLPIAVKNRKLLPKKQLKWIVLAGFCGNFIPMFLFPIAEEKISSSIAGIINSVMPIFVVIVGALVWGFTTTKNQIIGVLVSFVGVCILAYNGDGGSSIQWWPIILLLIATLLYAISTTTVKAKLLNLNSTVLSSFVFSFVLLLPSVTALLISSINDPLVVDQNLLYGLGFVSLLSVFGTGLAMMMNYRLLKVSSPLFASTVTLLMPIVAILWGVLDGETLSTTQLIGTLVIIGGLLFIRKK